MRREVLIVRTGAANLASVQAGLRRLDVEPVVTSDPERVRSAPHVILPGVGALGPTRALLDEAGLAAALIDRARAGRPLFAVCLGLQMLLESSEESEVARGLGLVPGRAERFPDSVRVPQLGWNHIEAPEGANYLVSGECYFANSFRLVSPPPGHACAMGQHGGAFVAAFEKEGLLACQFHPELSSRVGAEIMKRWIECSEGLSPC